ncbi:unnamed protein product [Trifolium pratense]|uniref:Uncharacterized protein n=1 Tax=Trifolium pratense TaxID=57577 RepID=A0ACB0IUJ4_TRIPR|nr:unnamed protein product [Trifolium pratense]
MSNTNTTTTQTKTWFFTPLAIILPVIVAAAVLYRLDPFEPVHLPVNELNRSTPLTAPLRNNHMRLGSEEVAKGQVLGPEDFVYDAVMGVVYTSCEDGWIKRVTVNESVADSVVENWINTGGRPLGLAFDGSGDLIVADAEKVTFFI